MKATARQRLVADQEELDLGLERTEPARRGCAALAIPSGVVCTYLAASAR